MSTRLENEAMTGVGLKFGSTASQPVETDATISQLPPATTDAVVTGAMTTPDGKSRSVVRCMWQDHVAADFVKANDLRKSGDLTGSFGTGFVAFVKAVGAIFATFFGTLAAGVVWWKDAPKAWDRSKAVEVLHADSLPHGEPSVSGSRTQPGLETVDEELVPGGDEGDDEASSVGSAADLRARNAGEDDQLSTGTVVHEADDATISVAAAAAADVSGSGVAVAQPDKKALKAAAKAQKAAAQAVANAQAAGAALKEIAERTPSKLNIGQATKQVAGSVGKMVDAARAASKANAENGDIGAHDKNVDATQAARKVAAQLTGEANSSDDVLALHKAVKELADDKGGTKKFVQLKRVVVGEHYPTTLTDEVMRVVNEQGLSATLFNHLNRDIRVNFDGSAESAEEVAQKAMKNLKIAVRRGIFGADQVHGIRQTLGRTFAKACESALIENLKTQDPAAAFGVYSGSLAAAVEKGLLTEDEAAATLENTQDNSDVVAAMSDSAVLAIAARENLADDNLEEAIIAIVPEHLQENGEFVSGVLAAVRDIRASEDDLNARVQQFAEARRLKAMKGALQTWNDAAKAKRQKRVEEESAAKARALQEAADLHLRDQTELLAAFDAQMKLVEAAQRGLQEQIDLLAASLERQDQLNLDLERIANTPVQIPVVGIVGGAVQLRGVKSVHVTEALSEINALRALVFGPESQIPSSKRAGQWGRLMEKNGALETASKASAEYTAKLQEVGELAGTISQRRQAVWQSLEAVQKLIATYGVYHAANIGNLDADKQPAVNQRLERVNTQLKAQTQIISQIGVESDEEQPVVPVQSAPNSRFADLFGADDAQDAQYDLFSASRNRAHSVFVPARQLQPGVLPGGAISPALSSVDGDEHPLAFERAPTPVAALQQKQPSRVASPVQVAVNLAADAVVVGRAQTPTVVATKPVAKPERLVSRSPTSSPVAVNAALWDRKPVVAGQPDADEQSEAGSVGEDFHSAQGDRPAAQVDGDEDLLSGDEHDYDSDNAGSDLNSRPGSPLGKPVDVQLPDDEE